MRRLALACGIALAAAAPAAFATPPPVMGAKAGVLAPASGAVMHGLSGPAVTLTPAELAKLPRIHLTLTHMGRTSDYSGPELATLLRRVDAPLGARLHGAAVADVVVLTASDDYRVALSLGELDPELRPGARVILADQEDGHALPPDEAPFRLVIDGEARPARDVHSVVSIELKHLP